MLQNTRNVIVACSCAVAWLQPDLPIQMGLCADENDFAGSSLRWALGVIVWSSLCRWALLLLSRLLQACLGNYLK